jgi:hypothetical protein
MYFHDFAFNCEHLTQASDVAAIGRNIPHVVTEIVGTASVNNCYVVTSRGETVDDLTADERRAADDK